MNDLPIQLTLLSLAATRYALGGKSWIKNDIEALENVMAKMERGEQGSLSENQRECLLQAQAMMEDFSIIVSDFESKNTPTKTELTKACVAVVSIMLANCNFDDQYECKSDTDPTILRKAA